MRSFITNLADNDVLALGQERMVVAGLGNDLRLGGLSAGYLARWFSHWPDFLSQAVKSALSKRPLKTALRLRSPRSTRSPLSWTQISSVFVGSGLAGSASGCPAGIR